VTRPGCPVTRPGCPVTRPGCPVTRPGCPVTRPGCGWMRGCDERDSTPPYLATTEIHGHQIGESREREREGLIPIPLFVGHTMKHCVGTHTSVGGMAGCFAFSGHRLAYLLARGGRCVHTPHTSSLLTKYILINGFYHSITYQQLRAHTISDLALPCVVLCAKYCCFKGRCHEIIYFVGSHNSELK
jgi:hypothetical protein